MCGHGASGCGLVLGLVVMWLVGLGDLNDLFQLFFFFSLFIFLPTTGIRKGIGKIS